MKTERGKRENKRQMDRKKDNLGDIEWSSHTIKPGSNPRNICQQLIDIACDFNFKQIVTQGS